MADDPNAGWRLSDGSCPHRFIGTEKRVFVELRNGKRPPESWRAHGKGGLTWAFRTGHGGQPYEFDVMRWKESK
jgi:hypothetical protein